MKRCVLITGGAGFIGSHVADDLLNEGYSVRVLDNLLSQVHGPEADKPIYLDRDVDFIKGDVRDPNAVRKALRGIDAVVHLAAMVGVGQSMYEVNNYTSVNNGGTSVLLEAIIARPVERLIVASSMSIYGEGLYAGPDGNPCEAVERSLDQVRMGDWELKNTSGESLKPIPTPETKPPCLASVYALSKYDQERMCMIIGRAYGIPTIALRFFNVYGPRQALSNPYTGVLAIFASRYMNGNSPLIYEDGRQQRDFVSVHDVARSCVLALEATAAPGNVFNIGSGNKYTVLEIAERLASVLASDIRPVLSGMNRAGDIRHCFADISKARDLLGYSPTVSLDDGMGELADWLAHQTAIDYLPQATSELVSRGLSI